VLGFRNRVSWTICLSWLRTAILLLSASRVARIIGVSHWRLAPTTLKQKNRGGMEHLYRTFLSQLSHRSICH
jgi:hypothetical protein